jgi:hypothetical protein
VMRPGTPQGDVSSRGCAPPVEIRAPDQLALIRAGGNSLLRHSRAGDGGTCSAQSVMIDCTGWWLLGAARRNAEEICTKLTEMAHLWELARSLCAHIIDILQPEPMCPR